MKNQEDKMRRHELDDGREGGRKTVVQQEHETFGQEPVSNFSDFAGKMVSVAATQLCHFRTERVTNEHCCVPKISFLYKNWQARFGP